MIGLVVAEMVAKGCGIAGESFQKLTRFQAVPLGADHAGFEELRRQ